MLANDVTSRVSAIMYDTAARQYPEAELLDWLNDGLLFVAQHAPGMSTVTESMPLDAGTLQTIPANRLSLLSITRNMGTDGATPGAVIKPQTMQALDCQDKGWHSSIATPETSYFVKSEDQDRFYVYPPSDGTGQVEAVFSKLPATTKINDTLEIRETARTALVNYCLYRAFSKDNEEQDLPKSDYYFKQVMQELALTESRKTENGAA